MSRWKRKRILDPIVAASAYNRTPSSIVHPAIQDKKQHETCNQDRPPELPQSCERRRSNSSPLLLTTRFLDWLPEVYAEQKALSQERDNLEASRKIEKSNLASDLEEVIALIQLLQTEPELFEKCTPQDEARGFLQDKPFWHQA